MRPSHLYHGIPFSQKIKYSYWYGPQKSNNLSINFKAIMLQYDLISTILFQDLKQKQLKIQAWSSNFKFKVFPDSKVHGANMEPTWGLLVYNFAKKWSQWCDVARKHGSVIWMALHNEGDWYHWPFLLLALCEGNSHVSSKFTLLMSSNAGVGVFFVVNLNKLLNKHKSYQWLAMPWHQRNVAVMFWDNNLLSEITYTKHTKWSWEIMIDA